MSGLLKLFRFPFRAMGSPCQIQLYANQAAQAQRVAAMAIADAERIESRYSRYRPDSRLSDINRIASRGGTMEVDEETAGLLDYAQACHAQSDGLFDITSGILRNAWDFQSRQLPSEGQLQELLLRVGWKKVAWRRPCIEFTVPGMELDFGGIGKEYAADRAATLCLENGIEHGFVDFGGDIKVIGPHPDGTPWHIGIRHPRKPDTLMATLDLCEGAIASSGDYERCIQINGQHFGHILNPKTGWPVQGLAAVSVTAPHCLVAGSGCTIAMLKEKDGPQWLQDLGLAHVCMDADGRIGSA